MVHITILHDISKPKLLLILKMIFFLYSLKDESQVGKDNAVASTTVSVAIQGMLLSACDTQTFRGIEGVQVTPAIPVTRISSTEKSEGNTKNLIFENFQVSNELLFVACFSGGIVMPGVFSWQPRRFYPGAILQTRRVELYRALMRL